MNQSILTNRKIDILVGIPSHNEQDSIRNTLEKIDAGLSEYYSDYQSLIVDIDSDSEDKTAKVFLNTKSITPKIVISGGKNPRGKGANIFTLLKLSKRIGAKYICMFDADVATITEKWLILFLDPLIKGRADFVIPIYTRNRYEANTTNHFCYPLLEAWFDCDISQPIAGDFAMNKKFIDYVGKQHRPHNAYLYGIDIFLTTHAAGGNFRIEEVFLGRKIHNSSFEKMIPMFQQVASTMIYTLTRYKDHKENSRIRKDTISRKKESRIDELIRKPHKTRMSYLHNYAINRVKELSVQEIEKYLGIVPTRIKSIIRHRSLISMNDWVKILASLFTYMSKNYIGEQRGDKIASLISPFFFLRVLAYFEELDKSKSSRAAESIIQSQVAKFIKLINLK